MQEGHPLSFFLSYRKLGRVREMRRELRRELKGGEFAPAKLGLSRPSPGLGHHKCPPIIAFRVITISHQYIQIQLAPWFHNYIKITISLRTLYILPRMKFSSCCRSTRLGTMLDKGAQNFRKPTCDARRDGDSLFLFLALTSAPCSRSIRQTSAYFCSETPDQAMAS